MAGLPNCPCGSTHRGPHSGPLDARLGVSSSDPPRHGARSSSSHPLSIVFDCQDVSSDHLCKDMEMVLMESPRSCNMETVSCFQRLSSDFQGGQGRTGARTCAPRPAPPGNICAPRLARVTSPGHEPGSRARVTSPGHPASRLLSGAHPTGTRAGCRAHLLDESAPSGPH